MRKLYTVIGAILLFAAGIGAMHLFLYRVVPAVEGGELPLEATAGEWFTLRYPSDSPVAARARAHVEYLEGVMKELLVSTGAVQADLPERINVFVHTDHRAQARIIARRRSPRTAPIYRNPVDIIYGEDPRGEFIQMIGDFTFGQNRCRLLRHGIIQYILDPQRDHHLAVAALPEILRLNLEELLLLAGRGHFRPTVYELFSSPFSAAADVGLEGAGRIFALFAPPVGVTHDLEVMAMSFISFLVDYLGGLDQVMRLWRPGSLERNLQLVFGYELDRLNERWQEQLVGIGPQDEGWSLLAGRGLIRVGRLKEAMALLALAAREEAAEASLEMARIHLLLGNWDEMEKKLEQAVARGVDGRYYRDLLRIYQDWSTNYVAGVRIHSPSQVTAFTPSEVESIVADFKERLGLCDTPFSADQLIIFYNAPPGLGPRTDHRMGVLQICSRAKLRYRVAEYVIAHLYRDQTRSSLLRRGLTYYLSSLPEADYVQQLSPNLILIGRPIHLIDFDSFPDEMVYPIAAGLIGYLLEEYGPEKMQQLWAVTSSLGGRLSFDTAMSSIYGFTRRGFGKRFTEW
ncbi:hypothetical protein LR021_02695 [Candidatus Bipolaricaulota bacterium]|nr:hypothetical protein [Candidatus Bipolaricaulota bacterium]